jgi:hypothetical protein
MAEQLVRGGAPLDIPTTDEVADAVDARHRAFWREQREIEDARQRERLRGKKRIEIFIPLSGSSTSAFIGQAVGASNQGNGPEQGFLWSIRLVSIQLAGTGTLAVYKSSSDKDTRRPLFYTGTGQPTQVATWSADQARIRFGEGLYIVGSTNLNSVYMAAWQLPAEREGEFA